MGRYRTLMTDTDREYIPGEGDATDHQRQQSATRVRNRIQEEIPQDIDARGAARGRESADSIIHDESCGFTRPASV